MIDYIKENIAWIKDLFTLIFTGTVTVIAILTYRRAKATILQPIRTEVIKKQSEILTKLLQILKEHNHSFDTYTGVYNSFNHSRVHHMETSSRLYLGIRKYLRIDKKW